MTMKVKTRIERDNYYDDEDDGDYVTEVFKT